MSKPIIAVLGATGVQGGSVVTAALKDGSFTVRALTRNATGEAAKKLKDQGCQVVAADADDPASLRKAFEGAKFVFGLTDFWTFFLANNYDAVASKANEVKQGKSIVDACKSAGVSFLLWSSLDDVDCPHWSSKAVVDAYRKEQSVPGAPLLTCWYVENLYKFGMLKKDEKDDKVWTLSTGVVDDCVYPVFSAGQTGGWAVPVFKDYGKWIDKDIHTWGDAISPKQMTEQLNATFSGKGIKFQLQNVDQQYFDTKLKDVIGEELWLNNKVFVDRPDPHSYRDEKLSKSIFAGADTFKQFLEKDAGLHKHLGI